MAGSPVEIEASQEAAAQILTKDIVERFLNDNDSVNLSLFTSIEDSAAVMLSTHEGDITLDGIKILNATAAHSLAKHRGILWLNGLESLSDAAAEALSQHEGFLSLNGLESLSDETAQALSRHRGEIVDLSVLEGLNDAVAQFIALEPAAARRLAKHGRLDLNGLTRLSDNAAEALSRHEGFINLSGLTSLSDNAVEALSRHKGFVNLSGLTSLSDAAAETLSLNGVFLWLEGQAEAKREVAINRAKEAMKTAENRLKNIQIALDGQFDPKEVLAQLYDLEKLCDIACIPQDSRDMVRAWREKLELSIAQLKRGQSRVEPKARVKTKAGDKSKIFHAKHLAEPEESEPMSDKAKCGIWCVSSIIVCVISFFWFSSFDTPVGDADIPFFTLAFGTFLISTLSSLISLIILGNWDNGGAPSKETITFLQRQQMINRLNDIRNDLNDE